MKKKRLDTILNVLISIFVTSLLIFTFLFVDLVNELSNINLTMSTADDVNVTIQRWLVGELTGEPSNNYPVQIEASLAELNNQVRHLHESTITSMLHLSGNMDECNCLGFAEYVDKNWVGFESEVYAAREKGWENTRVGYAASNMHFFITSLSGTVNDHFLHTTNSVNIIQLTIFAHILIIATMLIIRLAQQVKVFKEHKKLSEIAYLDTATGLFNRSKCEILFETEIDHKASAVCVMFDLNDLKLTNDTLGHAFGDRLIHDFAALLKQANEKYPDAFMGRYGGDEFILYYEDSKPDEVTRILSDLSELSAVFNMTETSFQISYAVGTACSAQHKNIDRVSDLIAIADEVMYQNKILVKERRKKEKLKAEQRAAAQALA